VSELGMVDRRRVARIIFDAKPYYFNCCGSAMKTGYYEINVCHVGVFYELSNIYKDLSGVVY
jgi:hypothetical protein